MDIEHFKSMVEDVGSSLKKDDDWEPMMFLENASCPDGKRGNVIVSLGMVFGNREEKDLAAQAMTHVIQQLSPDAVCFLSTAWKGPAIEKDGYYDGPPPSEHPDRVEIVLLLCIGKAGISDGEVTVFGEIDRSGDHPKINKWTEFGNGEDDSRGLFPDAIREGLQLTT